MLHHLVFGIAGGGVCVEVESHGDIAEVNFSGLEKQKRKTVHSLSQIRNRQLKLENNNYREKSNDRELVENLGCSVILL
jgi:uncharacterized protein (UPF0303 family)